MEVRGKGNFKGELRTAVSTHLRSLPLKGCCAVSLTLKQKADGLWLDDIKASQNLRHFLNRLNSVAYGNAFKRFGRRLNVVPVIERSSANRLHYHLVLQNPYPESPALFERLVEDEWRKTTFGYEEIRVDHLIDHGWTDYMSKTKTASDGIDWENYHWD